MLFCDDPQHLRRRTWLIIGLQIIQELTGIGVIAVYAPTVFQQAGYSEYKADLLSGINNISYMLTWLTVPWLVPTEIMPLYARAKGGCWSVVGWSIGNGIVTEIAPFLFNAITHWTFILFSAINFFTLPNVYFLLPETAGRSLEDMNILFESDSIFVHKAKHIDRPIKRIDLDDPPVLAAHPEALA
ncbi:hypothetical protein H4Q26_017429 [Puccinia striiformis f. sp. tritici PST-130]|nr:hypothetical protein H4Q26_017429 [Puccinia striiformis f. sp. tritici PST-130]